MSQQMTSTALYLLLLPIFAVVASIALGVLSLLFRSRWSAPEAEAPPRTATRAAPPPAAAPAVEIPQLRPPVTDRLREPELA